MDAAGINIREVAHDVGMSTGSCYATFPNVMSVKRVAATFIPQLLNFKHKLRQV